MNPSNKGQNKGGLNVNHLKKSLSEYGKRLEVLEGGSSNTSKDLDLMRGLMISLLVVVGLGFVSMVITLSAMAWQTCMAS